MLAEPLPNVVQRPQLEIPFSQLAIADRVPNLEIVIELIVQFLSIQPKPALRYSSPTNTFIGALVATLYLHTAPQTVLPSTGRKTLGGRPRPRLLQSVVVLFGQIIDAVYQGRLEVTLVFPKHA